jgi:hypothetical protein
MKYHPTFRSFLSSAAVSISPTATAGVVVYIQWPDVGRILLLLSGLMGLFTAMLLLQDILVHLATISVDDRGISVQGPLRGSSHVSWSNVRQTTLRERRNAVTRTDHLLIVEAGGHSVSYPTSALAESDEAQLLDVVRRHVPIVTRVDRAAV